MLIELLIICFYILLLNRHVEIVEAFVYYQVFISITHYICFKLKKLRFLQLNIDNFHFEIHFYKIHVKNDINLTLSTKRLYCTIPYSYIAKQN